MMGTVLYGSTYGYVCYISVVVQSPAKNSKPTTRIGDKNQDFSGRTSFMVMGTVDGISLSKKRYGLFSFGGSNLVFLDGLCCVDVGYVSRVTLLGIVSNGYFVRRIVVHVRVMLCVVSAIEPFDFF